MKTYKTVLACACLSVLSYTAIANNLAVTNVSITSINATTADIAFDISWSNSYRWMESVAGNSLTNHDAVWVFIKGDYKRSCTKWYNGLWI